VPKVIALNSLLLKFYKIRASELSTGGILGIQHLIRPIHEVQGIQQGYHLGVSNSIPHKPVIGK
jgi:hypothetical protein